VFKRNRRRLLLLSPPDRQSEFQFCWRLFGKWVQRVRVHRSAQPLAWKAAGLIEKETEILYEGKLQITSSKFQINLKFQYLITETHFHFPGEEGYFDSEPTIE